MYLSPTQLILRKIFWFAFLVAAGLLSLLLVRSGRSRTRALRKSKAIGAPAMWLINGVGLLLGLLSPFIPVFWSETVGITGFPLPISVFVRHADSNYQSLGALPFLYPFNIALWFGATHVVVAKIVARRSKRSDADSRPAEVEV